MSDHLFAINCHKDIGHVEWLFRLLREHSASEVIVYHDGGDISPWPRPGIVAPYQPDKCLSICNALDALLEHAAGHDFAQVSFLHGDMAPTDWPQFARFLARFKESGKAVTWSPMLPEHHCVSFCNLHFNLPLALALFPISAPGWRAACAPGNWFNEFVTTAAWYQNWHDWREHAYPMAMLTHPHAGYVAFPDGTFLDKLMHGPGFEYAVNDYCPESSVIHTHDKRFWDEYERHARF